jgi:hypothetical protein
MNSNMSYIPGCHQKFLVECNLATVRFRCNQEEVLKLHALGRSARSKLDTLTLSVKESNGITKLHASKVDTNTRPCSCAEGMEGSLGCGHVCWSHFFLARRDPPVRIETSLY